jgi:hypothetical protein
MYHGDSPIYYTYKFRGIVLGADWLRNLGPILMDFKELTMQFNQEGHQYKFQGITIGSPEIISSHRM